MNSSLYSFINQRLSRQEATPLYLQLDKAIREAIQLGELKPNDYLPSERILMQELNVSRKTVRHAFELLRNDQVIDRAQGLGTFVRRKINYALKDGKGFSDVVAHLGGVPSTHWLTKEEVPANAEVAEQLKLPAGQPVWQLKRLRYIDGMPVSIENSFIRKEAITDINDIDVSLYHYFQQHGIQIGKKTSYIKADMPDQETRELIQAGEQTPVLIIRQRTRSAATDEPLEYSINYCRSDIYEFVLDD